MLFKKQKYFEKKTTKNDQTGNKVSKLFLNLYNNINDNIVIIHQEMGEYVPVVI